MQTRCFDTSFLLFLVNVVVEQFNNQVHVRQDHSAAAVALAAELVERICCRHALLVNQVEVFVPFVAADLGSQN